MPDFPPDSVAFVTGAASGIGLAISKRLILDGISKIALIDVKSETLTAILPDLSSLSQGVKLLPIAVDCSKEEEVDAAVNQVMKEFGRLDFAVNAAGVTGSKYAATGEMESSVLDEVLGVNLKGLWLCERAELRAMMEREQRDVITGLPLKTRGSIVNIGSVCSLHAKVKRAAPYTIAKHGVVGLTKVDACDYASEGIRINTVCPGWIETNMTEWVRKNPSPQVNDALLATFPMNRWGIPEEVAYLASFLLSDKASFITGGSYVVDGGLTAV